MESVPGLRQDPIELARRSWVDAGWADAADGMAMVTSIMRVEQLLLGQIEVLLKCSSRLDLYGTDTDAVVTGLHELRRACGDFS